MYIRILRKTLRFGISPEVRTFNAVAAYEKRQTAKTKAIEMLLCSIPRLCLQVQLPSRSQYQSVVSEMTPATTAPEIQIQGITRLLRSARSRVQR
mmetsp:Transcript_103040/g.272674  ORF Transcript_103040/g.272674 Transcript_103040/m.272674 type:complete len:95 (-) Transcript_103040:104-388(-)